MIYGDRTKIEESTKNVVLVLEALPVVSEEKFRSALEEAKSLVQKFLKGSVEVKVLTVNNLEVELY